MTTNCRKCGRVVIVQETGWGEWNVYEHCGDVVARRKPETISQAKDKRAVKKKKKEQKDLFKD